MEKQQLLTLLKEIREKSPKRKFTQNFDLIFNLQGLDIKKPDQKVDFYLNLPHNRGKKVRACGFVDAQLAAQSKQVFDTTIPKDEFSKWANKKKEQKKLADDHDYFIAQVDLMSQVAATFGKTLGPKGKMPSPKAGGVVPATAQLAPLVARLQTLARVQTKNDLSVKLPIGLDTLKDEDIADNILAVYNTLLTKLPQEKNNLKNVMLKLTMGQPYKIEDLKKKEEQKKK